MIYPVRKPPLFTPLENSFLMGFTLPSPKGFKKINDLRSFLKGISAIGTAKEITVF
jgi:hypothetical protein